MELTVQTKIKIFILSSLFTNRDVFLSRPDEVIYKKIKKILFPKNKIIFGDLPSELIDEIVDSHIKYLEYDPIFARTLRNLFFGQKYLKNSIDYDFMKSGLATFLARNLLTAWISIQFNEIYTINECIALNALESNSSVFYEGDWKMDYIKRIFGIYIRRLQTRHVYEYIKLGKMLENMICDEKSISYFPLACHEYYSLPVYFSDTQLKILLLPDPRVYDMSRNLSLIEDTLVEIQEYFKESNWKMLKNSLETMVDNYSYELYSECLSKRDFFMFDRVNGPDLKGHYYCFEFIFNISPIFIYRLVTSKDIDLKMYDIRLVRHLWKKYINLLELVKSLGESFVSHLKHVKTIYF